MCDDRSVLISLLVSLRVSLRVSLINTGELRCLAAEPVTREIGRPAVEEIHRLLSAIGKPHALRHVARPASCARRRRLVPLVEIMVEIEEAAGKEHEMGTRTERIAVGLR